MPEVHAKKLILVRSASVCHLAARARRDWFPRILPAGSRRAYVARGARRVLHGLHWRARRLLSRSQHSDASRLVTLIGTLKPGRETVFIVSGTRFDPSDGQRPSQLALAAAHRGAQVIFGEFCWKAEDQRVVEDSGILVVGLPQLLRASQTVVAAAGGPRVAILTFPYPPLLSLLAQLNGTGWETVYDVMDDWREFHSEGQAPWYDREFEAHLARSADAVVAVTPTLAEEIGSLADRDCGIVQNGFAPFADPPQERPQPGSDALIVGYFGHLTPAWFDWDLVRDLAEATPSWHYEIIGYGGEPGIALPPNVRLLGKSARSDLATLAARWAVGIVPFRETKLAAAADPIKTYEYLALGLPTIVSGAALPVGAPSTVYRAHSAQEFVDRIMEASRVTVAERKAAAAFAESCSWSARLQSMLDYAQRQCATRGKDYVFSE